MLPSAIFNRFDLSASNGQHCGEYRVIYHKNNGNRFFLSFIAPKKFRRSSKDKFVEKFNDADKSNGTYNRLIDCQ
jgi:hypothetical protein